MEYLDELKPGKRENAFYVKSNFVDEEKMGIQSDKSDKFYIYVWDPVKNQHVEKLVNHKELDALVNI